MVVQGIVQKTELIRSFPTLESHSSRDGKMSNKTKVSAKTLTKWKYVKECSKTQQVPKEMRCYWVLMFEIKDLNLLGKILEEET